MNHLSRDRASQHENTRTWWLFSQSLPRPWMSQLPVFDAGVVLHALLASESTASLLVHDSFQPWKLHWSVNKNFNTYYSLPEHTNCNIYLLWDRTQGTHKHKQIIIMIIIIKEEKIQATVQLTTQTTGPTQYIEQQLVSVRTSKLDKRKFPRRTNNNSNRILALSTSSLLTDRQ